MSNSSTTPPATLPHYLVDTYHWAYLSPRWVPLLDHTAVVNVILWGQSAKLIANVTQNIERDHHVLQAACVYGNFSGKIIQRIGNQGALQIVDIAPIQLRQARAKLKSFKNVLFALGNLHSQAGLDLDLKFDRAICFFLLHEIPQEQRPAILKNLLRELMPNGRLIIVDYHKPRPWHPLKPIMTLIFKLLEPYAQSFINDDLLSYLKPISYRVISKKLHFGGLYQSWVIEVN